jgi:hypothetical protein
MSGVLLDWSETEKDEVCIGDEGRGYGDKEREEISGLASERRRLMETREKSV